MQAVLAGRSRRRPGSRYVYTGSLDGSDNRCCRCLAYGASGSAATSGIMLTVFGSTGFFRTDTQNKTFIAVGIVCLLLAVVFVALALHLSRQSQQRQVELTPRIPQAHFE